MSTCGCCEVVKTAGVAGRECLLTTLEPQQLGCRRILIVCQDRTYGAIADVVSHPEYV